MADHVELADATIALQRIGTTNGQPVLLLHGEDGTQFCQPFLTALSEHVDLLVPDHPGWGDSDRPEHVTSVRDIAELYLQLLDHLDLRLPVIGLSFGAWVAAAMAAVRRDRIEQLVLVSPIGVKFGGRNERDFVDLLDTEPERLASVLYGRDVPANRLAGLTDAQLRTLAVAQEAALYFTFQPYMHDQSLPPRLRRVDVPTTVVSGDSDRFVLRPGYFDELCGLFATPAAHVVVTGGGHRLEEDSSSELVQHLVKLINGPALVAASKK